MSRQEAWWEGVGGDDYLSRNRVAWNVRVPFWSKILPKFQPGDVLEVGCNAGWNLLAIRSVKNHPFGRLCGCDINSGAIIEARKASLAVDKCAAIDLLTHYGPKQFDLVFTAGVLIHVPPAEILRVMSQIKQVSRRWVLAIEYADRHEIEVSYRGELGLLWRRPYGALYEAMNLKLIEEGDAEGFDRCRWWLMERL